MEELEEPKETALGNRDSVCPAVGPGWLGLLHSNIYIVSEVTVMQY
jgi:hypothetical protein